jgi:hypothetical protein
MNNFETLLSKKAKEAETALKKQISLLRNTPQIIKDAMAYSLEAVFAVFCAVVAQKTVAYGPPAEGFWAICTVYSS